VAVYAIAYRYDGIQIVKLYVALYLPVALL
jgi:hypothetical protein